LIHSVQNRRILLSGELDARRALAQQDQIQACALTSSIPGTPDTANEIAYAID
jgi:hypothetical protein